MNDNVTRMWLAQLLMNPPEGRGNGRSASQLRSGAGSVPYWVQPEDSVPDFMSRWPSDQEFESRPPAWYLWEEYLHRLQNPPPVSPPAPPPQGLRLDPSYDPFRRRLEEFDAEYPGGRPLR
jgi:hypothetical protein